MRDGFVSMGHGRALINIDKKKDQIDIYEKIVASGLSVRDTEQLVRSYKEGKSGSKTDKKKANEKVLPEFVGKHLDAIRGFMATHVDISASASGKGKIVIPFHSKEEFQRLKKILSGE